MNVSYFRNSEDAETSTDYRRAFIPNGDFNSTSNLFACITAQSRLGWHRRTNAIGNLSEMDWSADHRRRWGANLSRHRSVHSQEHRPVTRQTVRRAPSGLYRSGR